MATQAAVLPVVAITTISIVPRTPVPTLTAVVVPVIPVTPAAAMAALTVAARPIATTFAATFATIAAFAAIATFATVPALTPVITSGARAPLAPATGCLRHFQGFHLQLALGELLDVGKGLAVAVGHQRQRHARGAGTTSAADAMHVVFGRMRQVVVNHGRQLSNVEAAGRHVGGHQHPDFAALEAVECFQAFLLGFVAMDGLGQEPFLLQVPCQPPGADLGVGEDDDLLDAPVADQCRHGVALHVLGGHVVDGLLDVLGQRIGPGHLDELRLVQEALGQLADFVREGGREHQVLTARIE